MSVAPPLAWLAAALPDAHLDPAAITEALHAEGLVATYADTHSGEQGGLWIAVPAYHDPARGLHWTSFRPPGEHTERFVRLSSLIGLTLDETVDETRMSLHVHSPLSTMSVVAHAEPRRTWLRDTAAILRARILRL